MLTSEQKKTVAEITNEEKNKKICGILGIHWHRIGTHLAHKADRLYLIWQKIERGKV